MPERTIDPEHNWFYQQGYCDGFDGRRPDPPDETRTMSQRSDYFAGHTAGVDDWHDSHGSPELDADANKLAGLGADPGPTLGDLE